MQIEFSNQNHDLLTLQYGVAQTELGALFVGFADAIVHFIGLVPDGQSLDQAMARRRGYFSGAAEFVRDDAAAEPVVDQIMAAWRGDDVPDLRISLCGTDFQQDVWRALVMIPKGQVCTYGDIALSIDRPKAVRAVGTANGNNPISLLVPCHRVVPGSGGVGGYGWGCDVKRRLLAAEGVVL